MPRKSQRDLSAGRRVAAGGSATRLVGGLVALGMLAGGVDFAATMFRAPAGDGAASPPPVSLTVTSMGRPPASSSPAPSRPNVERTAGLPAPSGPAVAGGDSTPTAVVGPLPGANPATAVPPLAAVGALVAGLTGGRGPTLPVLTAPARVVLPGLPALHAPVLAAIPALPAAPILPAMPPLPTLPGLAQLPAPQALLPLPAVAQPPASPAQAQLHALLCLASRLASFAATVADQAPADGPSPSLSAADVASLRALLAGRG